MWIFPCFFSRDFLSMQSDCFCFVLITYTKLEVGTGLVLFRRNNEVWTRVMHTANNSKLDQLTVLKANMMVLGKSNVSHPELFFALPFNSLQAVGNYKMKIVDLTWVYLSEDSTKADIMLLFTRTNPLIHRRFRTTEVLIASSSWPHYLINIL